MTIRLALLAVALLTGAPAMSALPRVASINLCTDQLLLRIADPRQIASLSWLAAEPEESMLAAQAAAYPRNYGSAEELLEISPDVVLGGTYTSPFTRRLLRDLGFRVVDVAPAESVADIARNLRVVAKAIDQPARGEALVRRLGARVEALRAGRPARRVRALVLRPGGFTVGAGSLADDLMRLAGLDNVAAAGGLDRWGSLSIEALLKSHAELLVYTGYRRDQASLANTIFDHPALAAIAADVALTEIEARFWACGLPESLDSAAALQRAARTS